MIVSVTEAETYRRCRRKWQLESSNRQALMPMVPATALSLGTFLHSALAAWLVDESKHPATSFMEAARDERTRIVDTFREQNGYSLDDGKLANIDDAITLGFSMMKNYVERWGSPLPEGFTLVAQEQRVMMPIPGTMHTEEWLWDSDASEARLQKYADPRPHYLQGRLDGIIKDTRNKLYVLEHKSYGNRPQERVLRTTDQFVAYHWLLNQLALGPVNGVAYDGMWKRASPPGKVDNRPGTLPDLFSRVRIEHAPEAVQEFENFLALEVNEMANNPAIYTNRTWDGSCFWSCGMEELCASMTRGEDTSFVLRTAYTRKPPQGDEVADTADAA